MQRAKNVLELELHLITLFYQMCMYSLISQKVDSLHLDVFSAHCSFGVFHSLWKCLVYKVGNLQSAEEVAWLSDEMFVPLKKLRPEQNIL